MHFPRRRRKALRYETRVRARLRADLLVIVAVSALLQLCAPTLEAKATRDAAAKREISKAIDQYLKMKFPDAEERLLGVIKACEDKCSASTIASAWMYVGVVRGSGMEDQASAREAFADALAADPGVVLDDAMATPETRGSFDAARDLLQGKKKSRAL